MIIEEYIAVSRVVEQLLDTYITNVPNNTDLCRLTELLTSIRHQVPPLSDTDNSLHNPYQLQLLRYHKILTILLAEDFFTRTISRNNINHKVNTLKQYAKGFYDLQQTLAAMRETSACLICMLDFDDEITVPCQPQSPNPGCNAYSHLDCFTRRVGGNRIITNPICAQCRSIQPKYAFENSRSQQARLLPPPARPPHPVAYAPPVRRLINPRLAAVPVERIGPIHYSLDISHMHAIYRLHSQNIPEACLQKIAIRLQLQPYGMPAQNSYLLQIEMTNALQPMFRDDLTNLLPAKRDRFNRDALIWENLTVEELKYSIEMLLSFTGANDEDHRVIRHPGQIPANPVAPNPAGQILSEQLDALLAENIDEASSLDEANAGIFGLFRIPYYIPRSF